METNYRRCASCRRVAPKDEFFRVVRLHPNHAVSLDQGMGRSVYVCRCRQCLQSAQRKDRLSRALKANVPPQIYADLWQQLVECPTDQGKTGEGVSAF
jgi:hypothetical protein